MPVEILALLIVPNKIVLGICFPDYPSDNRCPHVTIMTNEWKPVHSNQVLETTCFGRRAPFNEAYESLKNEGRVKDVDEIMHAQSVKILEREAPVACYFVTLKNPERFEAVTRAFF